MEVLSHDVVESILERVPVKSLLRFKSVSKRWQSTIESKNFQERQLSYRQQLPGPDLLFLTMGALVRYYGDDTKDIPSPSSLFSYYSVDDYDDDNFIKIISSSPVRSIKVHIKKWFSFSNSCDGLVCFCSKYESIIINPTTRWHRTFPLSNLQKQYEFGLYYCNSFAWFGFGKDKFSGTYKSVWLYKATPSQAYEKTITCEVFDFRNNAWRYVTCPMFLYDINLYLAPVHLEGSLYWLTKSEEFQVLSFDLHTETFQVVVKAPFFYNGVGQLYNLNNRLCVSDQTNRHNHEIWFFDSGNKTWNHMCSIVLNISSSLFTKSTNEISWTKGRFFNCIDTLRPLAVLQERTENKKNTIEWERNKTWLPIEKIDEVTKVNNIPKPKPKIEKATKKENTTKEEEESKPSDSNFSSDEAAKDEL